MPMDETLEGIELSQTSLTARVEGDSTNLVGFIIDIDRRFSTGVIRFVNIEYSQNPETENSSAEFTMYIYTTRR